LTRGESIEEIPEPHAFKVLIQLEDGEHTVEFEEHGHHDHDAPASAALRGAARQ
jgi:hypothetical protein